MTHRIIHEEDSFKQNLDYERAKYYKTKRRIIKGCSIGCIIIIAGYIAFCISTFMMMSL